MSSSPAALGRRRKAHYWLSPPVPSHGTSTLCMQASQPRTMQAARAVSFTVHRWIMRIYQVGRSKWTSAFVNKFLIRHMHHFETLLLSLTVVSDMRGGCRYVWCRITHSCVSCAATYCSRPKCYARKCVACDKGLGTSQTENSKLSVTQPKSCQGLVEPCH